MWKDKYHQYQPNKTTALNGQGGQVEVQVRDDFQAKTRSRQEKQTKNMLKAHRHVHKAQ